MPPGARIPAWVGQFGGSGSGGGRFKGPSALTVDRYRKDGTRAFVVDPGNSLLQQFSLAYAGGQLTAKHLGDIHRDGGSRGIATSPATSTDRDRVEGQVTYAGAFTATPIAFLQFAVQAHNGTSRAGIAGDLGTETLGSGADGVGARSAALDVDESGNYYVARARNATGRDAAKQNRDEASVTMHDPKGKKVKTYAGARNPQGIAVGPYGDVFVTSNASDDARVRRYDGATGCELYRLPLTGAAEVAVDQDGYGYVADTAADVVRKYSNDLTLLGTIGARGRGDGQFEDPVDIDVDAAGDVFVVDRGNDRVQAFAYPFGEGERQPRFPESKGRPKGCS